VKLIALVFAAVAVGGSGDWRAVRDDGVSVRFPPSWIATTRPLTPVTYPQQVVAIASYPLPRGSAGANGCTPEGALERLPATGAFVFGWEYARPSPFGTIRARDFPPRPRHFRLGHYAAYECLGPSYRLVFRQAGRFFQIHVVLGPKATGETRARVLRIIDSFAAKRR
jgi:hypothetical protein